MVLVDFHYIFSKCQDFLVHPFSNETCLEIKLEIDVQDLKHVSCGWTICLAIMMSQQIVLVVHARGRVWSPFTSAVGAGGPCCWTVLCWCVDLRLIITSDEAESVILTDSYACNVCRGMVTLVFVTRGGVGEWSDARRQPTPSLASFSAIRASFAVDRSKRRLWVQWLVAYDGTSCYCGCRATVILNQAAPPRQKQTRAMTSAHPTHPDKDTRL